MYRQVEISLSVAIYLSLTHKDLQFISPGYYFILITGNFESVATFLHTNDSDVCQSYLIRRCKYFRHFCNEL